MSSAVPSGECKIIYWMLLLATHCYTHYHLHGPPITLRVVKFKDLVAKQHQTIYIKVLFCDAVSTCKVLKVWAVASRLKCSNWNCSQIGNVHFGKVEIENAEFGRMEWPFSATIYSTAYSTPPGPLSLLINTYILLRI